ncbi:MAG: hypothetical protein PSX79_02915 [bacterium]|nr:hypothetical protein [bacterium]
MIGVLIALALAAQTLPPLDPKLAPLIAPVSAAIEAERAAQAALPPPADDAERLIRMGRIDQVGRNAGVKIDLSGLSPSDRQAAFAALWEPVQAIDEANQAQLLKMLPPEGWFYQGRYGPAASNAAFLIIQHSKPDLWRRFVPVMEPLVAKGEVPGPAYALMYDRLALSEGRLQRYGSQMNGCRDGHYFADKLEDPQTVDQRRAAIGFVQTLAQYEAYFATYPPCR